MFIYESENAVPFLYRKRKNRQYGGGVKEKFHQKEEGVNEVGKVQENTASVGDVEACKAAGQRTA